MPMYALRAFALLCISALLFQAVAYVVGSRTPTISMTLATVLALLAVVHLWVRQLVGEDVPSARQLRQKRTVLGLRPVARGKPPQLPFWWQNVKHKLPPHRPDERKR